MPGNNPYCHITNYVDDGSGKIVPNFGNRRIHIPQPQPQPQPFLGQPLVPNQPQFDQLLNSNIDPNQAQILIDEDYQNLVKEQEDLRKKIVRKQLEDSVNDSLLNAKKKTEQLLADQLAKDDNEKQL